MEPRPQKHFGYILSLKIVSGNNDFGSFILQKSYTWYNIINRQRQNAASLTPIPQTQWLLSPKSRVKIGLIHTFMLQYVYLKVTTVDEFLLTNVTSEPSAFIV